MDKKIHKGYFYKVTLDELRTLFARHVHNIRHNAQFPSALSLHRDFIKETGIRIPLSQIHSLSGKYYEPDLTVSEMKALINFIRTRADDNSCFQSKLQKDLFGKDTVVIATPLTDHFCAAGINQDDFARRANSALQKLARRMSKEAAKIGPVEQAAQDGLK